MPLAYSWDIGVVSNFSTVELKVEGLVTVKKSSKPTAKILFV